MSSGKALTGKQLKKVTKEDAYELARIVLDIYKDALKGATVNNGQNNAINDSKK